MKTGPLSPGQQRLWFLHQFDPTDPSHNTAYAYRLRGPLDLERLAAAFTQVAARHDALRTRFVTTPSGEPRAVVDEPAPVVVDLLTAASAQQAEQLVATRTNTRFDLAAAAPFQVTVVRLAEDDHVLCVVLHHINGDGWSFNVLRAEVAAAYAGDEPGEPPLQYSAVAAAAAAATGTGADLDWWVGRLAGAPPLELPTDRPRPARRTSAGDEVRFPIPAPLLAGVRELARNTRTTPYMVLLAAYQVLLSRHGGGQDFCVGTPAAGRDRPELEGVVGFLSTTMVLRCDLTADPAFTDLLKATRTQVLSALTHPDAPFEQLVSRLGIDRDLSRTPLYQAMFALHTHGDVDRPVPGLDAEPFPLGWHPARCDLSLDLYEEPGADDGADRLLGVLLHSTDLFDKDTARRLADRFLCLLADLLTDPSRPVSRLALLPDEERAQLDAWNATDAELPPLTLVDLLLAQARETPDAVAVVCANDPRHGRREIGYRELTEAAAGLAAELAARGIGPGSVVAVRSSRRAEMLVALLGTLCTGAAYLPVDPDYPQARVDYVIADSGAALTLDDADLDHVLTPGRRRPATELPRPTPEQPAYVLYTSGSTGNPKGVVVGHRALTNFLLALRALVGSTAEDRWLALTSLSFDISALELYLPLVTGGRVVVAGRPAALDGAELARLVRFEAVTHVQATPSGWRVALTGDLPRVTALTGGEPLPLRLARELRARVDRLVNVYGPTETTIWSTAWEIPEDPERVSIGRPIANTTVHVVDERGAQVPIGVPGELLIGGAGVADGYLGRPELTAERFVDRAGERVYRTGDVVRRLGDGTLEFFGRTDNQVKLRGHRIELGEIGAALETHPAVRQAVVGVKDERLVAFYVPAEPCLSTESDQPAGSRGSAGSGRPAGSDQPAASDQPADSHPSADPVGPPDGEALHAYLVTRLPAALVPAAWVALPALPLTPNGKVDRKALPYPDAVAPRPAGGRTPRGARERLVADVFAEVLELSVEQAAQVRADDDFFALGGHSLRAAMVAARLTALTGAPVPVGELFGSPTVAALAARLDRSATGAGNGADPGTEPRPRPEGTAPPLSASQERLWFLHRLDPDDAAYNMWLVRRLRGPLDEQALQTALDEVSARHESLRTRYPERDGAPVAVVEPPRPVPLERLDAADTAAAELLVAARTNAPFDLGTAPPLRASLIRLGDQDHVLCLVLHHINGDGWSLNLLHDELAARYSGRELASLPLQFGDIARWQRERDQSADLAYWQDRLSAPTQLDLPVDHPRAAVPRRRGALVEVPLDRADAEALRRLGQERGCTVFMVLLAAYQVLLARHTGAEDILVGTATAGRDRLELEPVIGYLTDVLVLRGELAGDPTAAELLDRTRADVLGAFAHQGVPFEELVAQLRTGRDLARTPLFQTMAILHNQGSARATDGFAGLTAEDFEHGFQQAKFELMLEVWQDERELLPTLVYDAGLFERETMERLAARFARLLRALPGQVERPLSALPLLAADESAVLSGPPSGPAPRVLDLFAAQVRERPDAVAVACGDERWTYARLDARAEELAAELPAGGVVGVRLGRSCETIAALLACWRAGSAYLPLDPAYPEQRLDFMTQDSGACVVLTAQGPVAAEGSRRHDGGAYVIYTSGSTGVPKGVLVGQEALAARVAWMREAYGLGPQDRVVQFASLSFDTHAEEIFPALASGARLELLPDGPVTLTDHLDGVTVLDLPTAYWHHLVDEIDRVVWPDTLRLVILGGEQVHRAAVDRWRSRFGERVRVVNTYGPTEATVIATAAELVGPASAPDDGARPPIGTPLAGTRIALRGRHGEDVPPGSPGELWIGGTGLAEGYLDRPGTTAERFPVVAGERWYRSGDLARLRADGQLEFLGRRDDQVKLRGFRIELGEIEAALGGRGAVAVLGDTLVGYVVGDPEPVAAELRTLLPAHLVPTLWVPLDALPLTPNGKLDRAALPEPSLAREVVAPRTDAEALVAEVFAEVLGLAEVGASDDFFALGGHSLLAVKVIARLREATDIELPVRALFDATTVAGVAAALEDLLLAEIGRLTEAEAAQLLAQETERTEGDGS
ncbi:non-ribosomal peptide synthetase [Streptacidiphilus jiangxiensis]|uniref:Amino acid adenylation domain-containing protein n=1 Tax=Streptacidiphilus jiangxiensis TaxID=235985 RepID=A0A1H7G499_STRJI|nr:non-ribosomal peptide synthetase [Streptacidiphilus jiangxiensis]SEK31290.1 amino acid adenylation domain-containing protein [Streptacidiphilus jiangxiensis]